MRLVAEGSPTVRAGDLGHRNLNSVMLDSRGSQQLNRHNLSNMTGGPEWLFGINIDPILHELLCKGVTVCIAVSLEPGRTHMGTVLYGHQDWLIRRSNMRT